ncbi:MAG: septum formation initiator family protein [Saprospiraceae bacterium]|nr:septum formation initiator family protein [Saprospiraceae bacterium]
MPKKSSGSFSFQKLISLILRHRILLIIAAFFVYLFFFDEYNLKTRIKVSQSHSRLTSQKENYKKLIEEAKQDKADLESNYEKFAREKYRMSREDEDIFIIETKKREEK